MKIFKYEIKLFITQARQICKVFRYSSFGEICIKGILQSWLYFTVERFIKYSTVVFYCGLPELNSVEGKLNLLLLYICCQHWAAFITLTLNTLQENRTRPETSGFAGIEQNVKFLFHYCFLVAPYFPLLWNMKTFLSKIMFLHPRSVFDIFRYF